MLSLECMTFSERKWLVIIQTVGVWAFLPPSSLHLVVDVTPIFGTETMFLESLYLVMRFSLPVVEGLEMFKSIMKLGLG